MNEEHLPIFVYGTLQRGEERAHRWPHQPHHVERATIRGRVHDLGPYPGLVPGEDIVLGELWHLAPEDFAATLAVLDQIECSGDEGVDLYERRIVECRTISGAVQRGYVYFFATPAAIRDKPIVQPDAHGYCHWRRNSSG